MIVSILHMLTSIMIFAAQKHMKRKYQNETLVVVCHKSILNSTHNHMNSATCLLYAFTMNLWMRMRVCALLQMYLCMNIYAYRYCMGHKLISKRYNAGKISYRYQFMKWYFPLLTNQSFLVRYVWTIISVWS